MLVHVQRNLTLEQLHEHVADAKIRYDLNPKKSECDDYETALLKSASYCIEYKKQQSSDAIDEAKKLKECLAYSAYVFDGSPSVLPVTCFDVDALTHIIGERTCEITGKVIEMTFHEYMINEQCWSKFPAVILGGNDSSGFGKSATAIRAALNIGKMLAQKRGLAAKDGRCIIRNSVEACRSLPDMRWPLVIDEFEPTDREQAKHWSLNIAKIMGNLSYTGDVRANYLSVDLCPQVPRIFTANSSSLAEWMGPQFADCLPILRRYVVFKWLRRTILYKEVQAWSQRMADEDADRISKDDLLKEWGVQPVAAEKVDKVPGAKTSVASDEPVAAEKVDTSPGAKTSAASSSTDTSGLLRGSSLALAPTRSGVVVPHSG